MRLSGNASVHMVKRRSLRSLPEPLIPPGTFNSQSSATSLVHPALSCAFQTSTLRSMNRLVSPNRRLLDQEPRVCGDSPPASGSSNVLSLLRHDTLNRLGFRNEGVWFHASLERGRRDVAKAVSGSVQT